MERIEFVGKKCSCERVVLHESIPRQNGRELIVHRAQRKRTFAHSVVFVQPDRNLAIHRPNCSIVIQNWKRTKHAELVNRPDHAKNYQSGNEDKAAFVKLDILALILPPVLKE